MEIRIKDCNLQADEEGKLKIGGYINVVNRESEMLYSKKRKKWFKEVMRDGVFKRSIENSDDIPLLFEHDWDKVLASTQSKTLSLKEDNIGLKFQAEIENRDVYNLVQQGKINSCSFGFSVIDADYEPIEDKLERRFVNEIELMEVSLVANPAYVGSLVETRAFEEDKEASKETEVQPEEEKEKASDTSNKSDEESKDQKESEDKVEEESKDEAEVDEKPSEDKQDQTRSLDDEGAIEVSQDDSEIEPDVEPEGTISKEEMKEIVDQLIDEKLSDIQNAQEKEAESNEILQNVQESNREFESQLNQGCMENSLEVIKLRIALLKLQKLKDGIN